MCLAGVSDEDVSRRWERVAAGQLGKRECRMYRGLWTRLKEVSRRRLIARLALVVALALAGPPAVTLVAPLVGADLSDQAQASDCHKKPKKSDNADNKPLCPPPPPPGG